MPTLRVGPSPFISGMAGGIPVATQGILDVLKLREAQRRNEALEAFQARQLAMQEAAAQMTAQEFARRTGLREQWGANASRVGGFLGTLQPEMRPAGPQTPAFAEPFGSGPELGGMLPPAGV